MKNLILILLGVLIMTGCGERTASWKEEVLLHDGKKIVVERSRTRGGTVVKEIGQDPETKWTIKFRNPYKGDELVSFEVEGGVTLMILDFDMGKPYLAMIADRGDAYYSFGCPNPPYVAFTYDRVWQRIPLDQLLPQFVKTNLTIGGSEDIHMPGSRAMTVEEVREYNNRPGLGRIYLEVDRTPIPKAGNCPINVSKK